MVQDNVVERFEQLAERYDALHRPGAWLQLKDELGLGRGQFKDELTAEEIRELNQELEKRLDKMQ